MLACEIVCSCVIMWVNFYVLICDFWIHVQQLWFCNCIHEWVIISLLVNAYVICTNNMHELRVDAADTSGLCQGTRPVLDPKSGHILFYMILSIPTPISSIDYTTRTKPKNHAYTSLGRRFHKNLIPNRGVASSPISSSCMLLVHITYALTNKLITTHSWMQSQNHD